MKELFWFLFYCALVAGAAFTGSMYGPSEWFFSLNQPAIAPPPAVFGPVWAVMYLLIAYSGWIARLYAGDKEKYTVQIAWLVQLLLNSMWTPIFFGYQSIAGGFIVILLLWVSIIWMYSVFKNVSRTASFMVTPYFAWVTFATILNGWYLAIN